MENQDRGSARTSRRQFISVAGLAATAVITLATSSTASAAGPTAPNPGSRVGDPAEAQAVQRVAETLLNSGVPGLAFAIVKPDEKNRKASVTTTYHYGHADVENGVRVTPRTQFEIASETKTFTAALLAKLIAQGEVGLDDLASKYSDGNPLPKGSGGEEITLRQLVTHRSGLSDDPPNLSAGCADPTQSCTDEKAKYTKAMLWEGLEDPRALEFSPGSHWLYSDFGFGLLGTLMADKIIPGQEKPPFAAAVAREITDPLGMMGTVIESKATDLAVSYYLDGTRAPLWNNTGAIAGGGGLVSTAEDMSIWAATTLGYGNSPLKPVLTSMLEQIDTQAPENPAFGMGMAWQLQPPTPNFPQRFAKKNGDSSGSNCITLLVPDSGWSITILANGGNAAMVDPAAVNLMHDLVPRRPIFGSSTGSSSGSDVGFQTGSFG